MFFLFFYSITIFCSDYIFIHSISDTGLSVYVSLNSLDNEIQSSLLIHKLSRLDTLKSWMNRYIWKWFDIEISNPPYYFYPVDIPVYREVADLLESVRFNNNEELELAKLFFNNRYILKTTFTPEKGKPYYIERLQVKRGPVQFIFVGSDNSIFYDNKKIKKIKWENRKLEHTAGKVKDRSKIYQIGLFKHADFYRPRYKKLFFKPTKEAVSIKSIHNKPREKELNYSLCKNNVTKTREITRKNVKNQEEIKKLNVKIVKENNFKNKKSVDYHNNETNVETESKTTFLKQCLYSTDGNEFSSNKEISNEDIKDSSDDQNKLISAPPNAGDQDGNKALIVLLMILGIAIFIFYLAFK
ncbi:putative SP-containing membrane protein [Vairimorpha necatrix]|uniref:SP-containing membrane protein n=1 Tax=Vairimorpha necatrix TaxID=6039 RepID=A0AAX4J9I5_9MICR